jgi:DNA-binding ferritin-like protein (Dps family)
MSIMSKLIGDKRHWREYKQRVAGLPAGYGTAVEGIERYLMHTGPSDADGLMRMLDDLADLFERAAADGTPVAAIVGDDPVEFAEEFKRNYGLGAWLSKEQQRLVDTIGRAERQGDSGTAHDHDDGSRS